MFSFFTQLFPRRIKTVTEITSLFSDMSAELQRTSDYNQSEADRHYQLTLHHREQVDKHGTEVAYAARVQNKIAAFLSE
jgi:hypothetical protein